MLAPARVHRFASDFRASRLGKFGLAGFAASASKLYGSGILRRRLWFRLYWLTSRELDDLCRQLIRIARHPLSVYHAAIIARRER
jgi:hypothetical protein